MALTLLVGGCGAGVVSQRVAGVTTRRADGGKTTPCLERAENSWRGRQRQARTRRRLAGLSGMDVGSHTRVRRCGVTARGMGRIPRTPSSEACASYLGRISHSRTSEATPRCADVRGHAELGALALGRTLRGHAPCGMSVRTRCRLARCPRFARQTPAAACRPLLACIPFLTPNPGGSPSLMAPHALATTLFCAAHTTDNTTPRQIGTGPAQHPTSRHLTARLAPFLLEVPQALDGLTTIDW